MRSNFKLIPKKTVKVQIPIKLKYLFIKLKIPLQKNENSHPSFKTIPYEEYTRHKTCTMVPIVSLVQTAQNQQLLMKHVPLDIYFPSTAMFLRAFILWLELKPSVSKTPQS